MSKATSRLLLLPVLLCVTSTSTLAQAPPNALFLDAGVQKNALASRQTDRLSRLEQKPTTLEAEVVRVADLRGLDGFTHLVVGAYFALIQVLPPGAAER